MNEIDKKIYNNLKFTIARDIRQMIYQNSDLIPIENQEIFMNPKNIQIQCMPDYCTVIYFLVKGNKYGIIYQPKNDIIVMFDDKTNRKIMTIKGEIVKEVNPPLVRNKPNVTYNQDPFGIFFIRAFRDWQEDIDKIAHTIPVGQEV